MLPIVQLGPRVAAPRIIGEDELLPLAVAAGRGDARATQTLLTILGAELLRVVRRVLGSHHPDVEDVTQECAIELIRSISRFRKESSVRHFANRVALQTAMNSRRRLHAAKRDTRMHETVDPELAVIGSRTPESDFVAGSSIDLLRRLCDELPVAQSDVLSLHYVLGYTIAEISRLCGVPAETVRSRLRLAKGALNQRINDHPDLRALLEAHS